MRRILRKIASCETYDLGGTSVVENLVNKR